MIYKTLLFLFVNLLLYGVPYSYSYAYDLSTESGIEACKNDSTCYICKNPSATTMEDGLLQCTPGLGYDNPSNMISSSNYFCPAPETKQKCSVDTSNELLSKSLKISIKNPYKGFINNSIKVGFKDTLITIEQQLPNGQTVEQTIDFTNEFNSIVKPYIDSEWNIKKSYIQFYYYKPDTSIGSGGESSSFCPEGEYISNTVCNNNQSVNINIYENINVGGDCRNARASLEEFQIFFDIEKNNTKILCPINENNPCYKEGSDYYCTSECIPGNSLNITPAPPLEKDEIAGIGTEEPKENDVCTVDGITIADGTYMSCRLGSKINALADNCCFTSMDNKEKQEDIMTGVSDVLSVAISFGPGFWVTAISDIFKAAGWIDVDIVAEWFKGALDWLQDGVCTNAEILAGTYSYSTRGVTYNYRSSIEAIKDEKEGILPAGYDGGNCVYFGEFCSGYFGNCWEGTFLGIYYNFSMFGCKRPSRAFCCYSNLFDKALAKAARDQMSNKYDWGKINGKKLSPYSTITPGENPCRPDYKNINVDCSGVSITDLANISLDTVSFQKDIEKFSEFMLKDITKPGGALDASRANTENAVNDFKNQNPNDIINDALGDTQININDFK